MGLTRTSSSTGQNQTIPSGLLLVERQGNPPGLQICVLASLSKSANPSAKHYSTSVSFTAQHRFPHKQTTFCLIETWQQPTDFSQLHHATPPGFVSISQPCSSSRGGGLAIICHENGKPCLYQSLLSAHSNALWGGVAPSMHCKPSEPTPTNIATVYCPPRPHNDFFE